MTEGCFPPGSNGRRKPHRTNAEDAALLSCVSLWSCMRAYFRYCPRLSWSRRSTFDRPKPLHVEIPVPFLPASASASYKRRTPERTEGTVFSAASDSRKPHSAPVFFLGLSISNQAPHRSFSARCGISRLSTGDPRVVIMGHAAPQPISDRIGHRPEPLLVEQGVTIKLSGALDYGVDPWPNVLDSRPTSCFLYIGLILKSWFQR